MFKQLIFVTTILAAVSGVAGADPIDPDIAIDDGCCSTGIFVGASFGPTANGGGLFDFENDLGSTITELVLTTTLDPNSIVHCNSGFFLFCGVSFNGDTLTLDFHGVNPPDARNEPRCDTEFGEHEGIPIVQAGCVSTNGSPIPGHFIFNLNNGNVPTGDKGGWTDDFTVTRIVLATPEPSAILLLATGVLLAGGIARRQRRRGPGRVS